MNPRDPDNVVKLLEFRQRQEGKLVANSVIEQENDGVYYRGASIVDILRVAGLDQDLHTDAANPKNCSYTARLTDEADERMAERMASISFGALAQEHSNDVAFDHDKAYEQCVIDARHMILNESYARLFGSLG